MSIGKVYALISPLDQQTYYVGKTLDSLEARLKGHISSVKQYRWLGPRFRWIEDLLRARVSPEIKLLEQLPTDWQAQEEDHIALNNLEAKWVAHGFKEGWPLTNVNKPKIKPPTARQQLADRIAHRDLLFRLRREESSRLKAEGHPDLRLYSPDFDINIFDHTDPARVAQLAEYRRSGLIPPPTTKQLPMQS